MSTSLRIGSSPSLSLSHVRRPAGWPESKRIKVTFNSDGIPAVSEQNDVGPQKIYEEALKDMCNRSFDSKHHVVLIVAPDYLNSPEDALKLVHESLGIDYPPVLIEDAYSKNFGGAVKYTCYLLFDSAHHVVSTVAPDDLIIPEDALKFMRESLENDYPAVLIKDPDSKIFGDAVKYMCYPFFDSKHHVVSTVAPDYLIIPEDAIIFMREQKIFELKDGYYKFAGNKGPIISIGDPFNPKTSGDAIIVTRGQNTFEALKDGYYKFAGNEGPFVLIGDPFNLKISGDAMIVMHEPMIFEALKDGYYKFAGNEGPFVLIGDPFNLKISGDAVMVMREPMIFEALKDGYYKFVGNEGPTLSIGDPFNPKISGDAIMVMCELKIFEALQDGYHKFAGSEGPIFSIGDSLNPKISGDALKDLYKSFGSEHPIINLD